MEKTSTTVTLRRAKETPNKVKFVTVPVPGTPPPLDDVYVPKWWAGDTQEIELTITKKGQ